MQFIVGQLYFNKTVFKNSIQAILTMSDFGATRLNDKVFNTYAALDSLFCFQTAFKKNISALAGVSQWIECWPEKQGLTGSIPSQGTHVGCSPVGGM